MLSLSCDLSALPFTTRLPRPHSKVSLKYPLNMWPWTTKPVIISTGIFVAIANNTLYGSKLSIFLLCQKSLGIKQRSCSMKIFCKFPTVNISKHNFWLVICIAKDFVWANLKAIFSIFRFFLHPQIPDFQILSYPNKPYINGKLICSASR